MQIQSEIGYSHTDHQNTVYIVDASSEMLISTGSLSYRWNLVFRDSAKNTCFIKESLQCKMRLLNDEIITIDVNDRKLTKGHPVELLISPTQYNWSESFVNNYHWTLEFSWHDSPICEISLPPEIFNVLGSRVTSKEVDRLSIVVQGGFWTKRLTGERSSQQDNMTRYVKPGSLGQVSEPVICKIISIRVHGIDESGDFELRSGANEYQSNSKIDSTSRILSAIEVLFRFVEPQLVAIVTAIFIILTFFAFR